MLVPLPKSGASRWVAATPEHVKRSNPLGGSSRWVPAAAGDSHGRASRSADFDSPGSVCAWVCGDVRVRVIKGMCVDPSFPASHQLCPLSNRPSCPNLCSCPSRILRPGSHNMKSMHFMSRGHSCRIRTYWPLPNLHLGCVRR